MRKVRVSYSESHMYCTRSDLGTYRSENMDALVGSLHDGDL
jgi:hypothetical protein